MPDPVTWGHLLMLAGLLAALYGLMQLMTYLRYRSPQHGRGTPGYARARDGRRYALWGLVAGALLYAVGCFTPLAEMALA